MDLLYLDVKDCSRTGAASGPSGTDAEMLVPILRPLSPTGSNARLSPCRAETTEWLVPWAWLEFLPGMGCEVVLQRGPWASEDGCRVVSWCTGGTQGVCNTQYWHSVRVPPFTGEEGEDPKPSTSPAFIVYRCLIFCFLWCWTYMWTALQLYILLFHLYGCGTS